MKATQIVAQIRHLSVYCKVIHLLLTYYLLTQCTGPKANGVRSLLAATAGAALP